MNLTTKAAVVAGAVLAVGVAVAAPASAASFGPIWIGGGAYSYNDGQDLICATATNSSATPKVKRYIEVNAWPLNSSDGPSRQFRDYNNAFSDGSGNTCRSLATAYEDSSYRVSAIAFEWNTEFGQWVRASHIDVRDFYS
ncbi:hypothetical protein [Amycolatopsis sp. lyj-112]|uniref:hypothetical protein n=1 Tax=Amycolatopsis sp. lyj-112 TaxID=2789288 RepID=UPI00397DAB4E